jgi:lysozyme
MKALSCIFLWSLILATTVSGQTNSDQFKEPWKDRTKAIVLDPYCENSIDWTTLATESRVGGIIHKASEGLRADPEYIKRKAEGVRRGYKWGSYHLGRSGNPIIQADFYLKTALPTEDEVMALDLEDTTPRSMSLANAERFINRIKAKTGRYPLLYVTGDVREAILRNYGPNSAFAKTPLWYARYLRDTSQYFPSKLWSSYTLWQFASEINCPSRKKRICPLQAPVPGTEYSMDINVYYGTVEELRSKWPFTFRDQMQTARNGSN